MVRIKDIAEMAGVSTATVSNVIHGNTKKVSPATVEKIQEIMKRVDYVPSMGARMLAGKKSNIIGVIVGITRTKSMHHITDPFLSTILGAMEGEIYEHGYYMIFHQTKSTADINRLVSKWNVDGVITIGLSESENLILQKNMESPLISVDVYYKEDSVVNIGLDDFTGGYEMTKYLLSRGCRKIVFLADNDAGVDHERFLGYCKALEETEGEELEKLHEILPVSRDERLNFHSQNLEIYKNSDALFFASDYYAVEGVFFLQENGLDVPKDISVAGFDDNFLASMNRPALTTVHQNIEDKGVKAVRRLIELISGAPVSERNLKLPVKLKIRNTVK